MGKLSQLLELMNNLGCKIRVMDGKRSKKPLFDLLQKQYPQYHKNQFEAFLACRQIIIAGETCTSLETLYPQESRVDIMFTRYVSRGGLKLEYALRSWSINVNNVVMLDAGSSTGGFTDCLLQHGASLVHAVDVGYNQLDYKLRVDGRVQVHERQNIMHITSLDPQPAAAVADLSFRSITGAASHILSLTSQSWMIALIKPQFEIAKGTHQFSGVVTGDQLLVETLLAVYKTLQEEGVGIEAIVESPILGRKGNREFLALLGYGIHLDLLKFSSALETLVFP